MDYTKACEILEIPLGSELDGYVLKQHYRFNALRYHPDKNHSPDSTEKFQQVKEAYDFLLKKIEMDDDLSDDDCEFDFNIYFSNETNSEYNSILFHYLKHYLKNPLIVAIINKITDVCESKALSFLSKIDRVLLVKIYEFMKQYKPIFYVSDTFFEKFESIIQTKSENEECIIIHPLLDDLLKHDLYKMNIDNNNYIIPLWHRELVYDHIGNDIYFKCYPILPENMLIDNENNLFVDISYHVSELIDVEYTEIDIGKKKLNYM